MPYRSTDLDLWRNCNDPEKRAAKFFFQAGNSTMLVILGFRQSM